MIANIPKFQFPAPGPDLPSWPAFTNEPFKPGNNPSDYMRIYLQYLLDDRDNYPVDGFGPGTAPVQIHDIIDPLVIGSNPESDTTWTDYIQSVQIYCLVCPPLESGGKRGETDDLGWPFCGGDIQAIQSTSPASDEIAGWTSQGEVDQGLVVPKPSDGWENTSLACTLAMYTAFDVIDATVPLYMNRPSARSQLFIVSSTPRDGASDFGVLMPYRYSAYCTHGTQNGTACNEAEPSYSTSTYGSAPTSTQDTLFPTSIYPAPARNSIDVCVPSKFNNCRKDGWYGWPIGQRVGVIIGVVVGVIIVILLLRRVPPSVWSHKREKTRPVLLSELRSQQAIGEGAAAERRCVERTRGEHASTSRGSGNAVEQPVEDVPPTYKEAMKDRRRTSGEGRPRMNEHTSTGWPPVYADAVQQPAPVANTPLRVPYPSLPASPPRR
ncbi:hypothetical protein AG0111_0g584 [Alternaria gaisen]|uniref:Uncharacterized protein n=1 Tax=Alternaria gaisen TaxID=167740 RepID=A0ACB6G2R1_9PLEO|nr:hypothetical protein AG0111_0g584 [Alternaria gaisen]